MTRKDFSKFKLILKIKKFYSLNIFPKDEEKVEFLHMPHDENSGKFVEQHYQRQRAYNYVGLTWEKRKEFSIGNQNVKLGILDDGKIRWDWRLFKEELITNKGKFSSSNDNFGKHAQV